MKVTIKSKAEGARVVSVGGQDYVVKPGSHEIEPYTGHDAKAVAQAIVRALGPAVASFEVKLEKDEDTEDALLIQHVGKMQSHVLQPLRKPTDTEHYSEDQIEAAQVQWAKEDKARSLGRTAEHVDSMKSKDLRTAGAPEVKAQHAAKAVQSGDSVSHANPKHAGEGEDAAAQKARAAENEKQAKEAEKAQKSAPKAKVAPKEAAVRRTKADAKK